MGWKWCGPFDFIVQTLETLDFSLTLMLVDNSMFNFYRENSFAIEFRVIGGGWVVALLILLSAKVLFCLDLEWNTLTLEFGVEYFDFRLWV